MVSDDPGNGGRIRSRLTRWREGSFGPASEKPFRRRWSEALRLGIANLVATLLALKADEINPSEQALHELFSSLPDGFTALANDVFALGGLWALGLDLPAFPGFVATRDLMEHDYL